MKVMRCKKLGDKEVLHSYHVLNRKKKSIVKIYSKFWIMKDFTHIDCCINCENFCFWDGDYCCFPNFMIHQYNITNYPEFSSNPNKGFFSDSRMSRDIDRTMKLGKDCEDYHKWGTYMYAHDCPNTYLEEYKKFKEWDRLCYQLEQHVSDPSGYYELITKPKYFNNK